MDFKLNAEMERISDLKTKYAKTKRYIADIDLIIDKIKNPEPSDLIESNLLNLHRMLVDKLGNYHKKFLKIVDRINHLKKKKEKSKYI